MKRVNLYINSENRTSGDPENFKLRLNKTISDIHSIHFKACEIPFSYYPVNSSNNLIIFRNNVPSEWHALLTPGNYTGDELATEIQTQMNAQVPGFTVTYDDKTLKYTWINATTTFEINSISTAIKILGLDTTDPGVASSYTSKNCINITGTNHLYIISSKLTQGNELAYADTTQKNIYARIPIDVNFGEVLRYKTEENDSNVSVYDGMVDISDVDFQLVDEDFNQMDLNGLNWNMEFVLDVKNN